MNFLNFQKTITMTLIAIVIIGIIGIPMGDPKFILNALVLESAFFALAIISYKKVQFSLIPNIVIAVIVIVGNTVSSQHIEIMIKFEPMSNAIVLIVGGYILQGILLVASTITILQQRKQIFK